jgi:hypothetical protein
MKQRTLPNDFAIFILSHKRPENPTIKTLKKCNYKGKYFFILDDLDESIPEYEKKYGKDHILIFSKKKVAKRIDFFSNWEITAIDTYARNACFDLAKENGINYWLTLDDDYDSFRYRFPGEKSTQCLNITSAIYEYLEYFKAHPQITSLCWAQGADLAVVHEGLTKRKGMNAFFHSIDRFVTFKGHMNDDVNTYTRYNQLGHIIITFPFVQLNQEPTQTTGGSAQMYKENGTYQKSWYSILQCPSFIKISTFTGSFRMSKFRIHHKINFKYGTAQIISSKYKK